MTPYLLTILACAVYMDEPDQRVCVPGTAPFATYAECEAAKFKHLHEFTYSYFEIPENRFLLQFDIYGECTLTEETSK